MQNNTIEIPPIKVPFDNGIRSEKEKVDELYALQHQQQLFESQAMSQRMQKLNGNFLSKDELEMRIELPSSVTNTFERLFDQVHKIQAQVHKVSEVLLRKVDFDDCVSRLSLKVDKSDFEKAMLKMENSFLQKVKYMEDLLTQHKQQARMEREQFMQQYFFPLCEKLDQHILKTEDFKSEQHAHNNLLHEEIKQNTDEMQKFDLILLDSQKNFNEKINSIWKGIDELKEFSQEIKSETKTDLADMRESIDVNVNYMENNVTSNRKELLEMMSKTEHKIKEKVDNNDRLMNQFKLEMFTMKSEMETANENSKRVIIKKIESIDTIIDRKLEAQVEKERRHISVKMEELRKEQIVFFDKELKKAYDESNLVIKKSFTEQNTKFADMQSDVSSLKLEVVNLMNQERENREELTKLKERKHNPFPIVTTEITPSSPSIDKSPPIVINNVDTSEMEDQVGEMARAIGKIYATQDKTMLRLNSLQNEMYELKERLNSSPFYLPPLPPNDNKASTTFSRKSSITPVNTVNTNVNKENQVTAESLKKVKDELHKDISSLDLELQKVVKENNQISKMMKLKVDKKNWINSISNFSKQIRFIVEKLKPLVPQIEEIMAEYTMQLQQNILDSGETEESLMQLYGQYLQERREAESVPLPASLSLEGIPIPLVDEKESLSISTMDLQLLNANEDRKDFKPSVTKKKRPKTAAPKSSLKINTAIQQESVYQMGLDDAYLTGFNNSESAAPSPMLVPSARPPLAPVPPSNAVKLPMQQVFKFQQNSKSPPGSYRAWNHAWKVLLGSHGPQSG